MQPALGDQIVGQILLLHDAERVAEIAAARHDQPRIRTIGDLARDLARIVVEVDPVDVRPRRHDRGDRAIRQRKHAVDHLLLDRVDDAGFGALGDREPDLFLGDAVLPPFGNAQERQQAGRRAFEQPDERPEYQGDDMKRARHPHGDRLRRGQRDPLRHQFADDHRHRRDGDHHQHDGDLAAIWGDARDAVEHRPEAHAERGAAEGAGQDADQGDADLHGRQKPAGIVGQRQRLRGAAPALLGHLLQPDTA